jgi:hypothetical protein
MGSDPEHSPGERRLARHRRTGRMDLVLFGIFWLTAALGLWSPLYAAVATGFFAMLWTTQFIGLRLALRLEHREAAESGSSVGGQIWKPGERALLVYLMIDSVVVSAVMICGVRIAVHFDMLPRFLAIALTSFVTLIELVAAAMFLITIRRAQRELEGSRDAAADHGDPLRPT